MAASNKRMETIMSYHAGTEASPSDIAASLQEKMERLRQQITEAQNYRRQLEGDVPAPVEANGASVNGLSASYWKVEKQITDLRIWEMESRLTGLLDRQGD
jgi:flagellar hook-associated protein FlgK